MNRPRAYAPVSVDCYRLPNGTLAFMSDLVVPQNVRMQQEIMLIQLALGVSPDGMIGIQTRLAVRQLASCPMAKACPLSRSK